MFSKVYLKHEIACQISWKVLIPENVFLLNPAEIRDF
jgi:hypothetical protein